MSLLLLCCDKTGWDREGIAASLRLRFLVTQLLIGASLLALEDHRPFLSTGDKRKIEVSERPSAEILKGSFSTVLRDVRDDGVLNSERGSKMLLLSPSFVLSALASCDFAILLVFH